VHQFQSPEDATDGRDLVVNGITQAASSSDIKKATATYEQWMRECTPIVEADLRTKHGEMRKSVFLFLRGTFYRWAQLWPTVCTDLCDAPKVLAVGDLHVNSFGTWRDSEGRLCWGIDDFDESFPLPYTNDLVRLATSVKIVIDAEGLAIKLKDGIHAILDGYRQSLKTGGCPLVLAEHEEKLAKLGISTLRPPPDFWKKLNRFPAHAGRLPRHVKSALEKTLPDAHMEYKVVRRAAGLGSLGQQRLVAIAEWNGGCIAREAKAMLPSACAWLKGKSGHHQSYYQQAIGSAVRSHDPYQELRRAWLIRRLSPDSNPIGIDDLPKERDEALLLSAMGSEVANVHLGTARHVTNILKDLKRRNPNCLRVGAKKMARVVEEEWQHYRES
jgi:hypothetical protein